MSDTLQQHWRVSDDTIANPVGGETVILHLSNGVYFGLDPIGSLLWEGLKSGQRPSDICVTIMERYDVEREQLENDLRQFLSDLHEHDLVTQA